jgi:hypothetical protein
MMTGAVAAISAQKLLVSEDFSSPAWEAEFLRLNPGNDNFNVPINLNATNPVAYQTPGIGGNNAYFDLNSTDLYFGKYKLSGSVEALDVLPCPLGKDDLHQNISPVEITFADPSIYSENGKYYLSGTRGGSPAGFVLLESTNLTEWQLSTSDPTGMILKKGDGSYGESGFWAPQIFKDNAQYYLTYTASEHVAIASSPTLNGKYTQNTIGSIDPDVKNIDSYLFKDEDGKYYLYHVRFNNGNYIWVAEFNMTTGRIDKRTLKQCLTKTQSWEATPAYVSNPIMEGPTVIKKEGLYYLFYSANHFQSIDYAVGYATATSPMGPWTKNPNNPIIHRSIVNENGSGHGDLFFNDQGNPYYVYHVHQSDSTVAPRKTRIVPLSFNYNATTGKYDISAKANEIIIPKVRASNDETYKTIESAFTGTKKSVAFRLNNNDTGLIEFPELPDADSIILHIRNGNSGSPTNVALEKMENGGWKQIHVFDLQNWGAYPAYRDEVLKFNIDAIGPVKLRLINNVAANRYMNLYRVDITSKTSTGLPKRKADSSIKVYGRKIITNRPVKINIYSITGVSLLTVNVEEEYELPATISSGIYLLKSNEGIRKILL